MASIYIYNLKGGKCVELNSSRIGEEDIIRLKRMLPDKVEGLSFESPLDKFGEDSISEVRVEDRENRVAEYLKGIGKKLEEIKQVPGALGFYDLAFRVSKNSEMLILKAQTLAQLGHVDKAERLLGRYQQKRPEAPEPYFMYGKHALSRNDYQTAYSHFQKARERIRSNNIQHRSMADSLEVYLRFVKIYLDRDGLFTRNLSTEDCIREIQSLQERTQQLCRDIREKRQTELEGMVFFLQTQDEIFQKWLQEMTKP